MLIFLKRQSKNEEHCEKSIIIVNSKILPNELPCKFAPLFSTTCSFWSNFYVWCPLTFKNVMTQKQLNPHNILGEEKCLIKKTATLYLWISFLTPFITPEKISTSLMTGDWRERHYFTHVAPFECLKIFLQLLRINKNKAVAHKWVMNQLNLFAAPV